jgi:hypothetical protein
MTLDEAIELLEDKLQEDILALSPKDRVTIYFAAKEYHTPKRQRTSIDQDDNKLPNDLYNE